MVRTKRSVALALLVTGLFAVGCSSGDDDDVASLSGDDDSESADSDKEAQEKKLYDWVDCMQEEGIPIGDPTRDADGNLVITDGPVKIGGGEGGPQVNVGIEEGDDPEFSMEDMQAAEKTCGTPPPIGNVEDNLSEEEIAQQQQDMLDFAKCMREDGGIEDFEDPDFSGEGPGGAPQTQGGGPGAEGGEPPAGGGGGPGAGIISGPFGTIDLSDPEMKAAFEMCGDKLGEGMGEIPEGPGSGEGGGST